ncbi:hypothetical protein BUALT_Bualt13G0076700 [Buddleja alternifolia]|uniref:RING-type E3 ubiquitin transferase n=1 Tax=Buddleja alternifolia TaxID=168488 RepID=A0AAV6WSS5_9LAMI|nr:hypothetical protein BUALT_Bualt13G0076700 [Buddleja alternifolia]
MSDDGSESLPSLSELAYLLLFIFGMVFLFLCLLLTELCHRYGGTAESTQRVAIIHNPAAQPPRRRNIVIKYHTYIQNPTGAGESVGCSICLDEYKDGESLATIDACEHMHHASCIIPWLITHDTCPICRSRTSINV